MLTASVAASATYFRPFIARYLHFNWQTGVLLLTLFSLVRFALVLQANVTKSYQVVAFIFVAMASLPFLLLTRAGRQQIGLVTPTRWTGVLLGGLLGGVSCWLLFLLTTSLFGWGEGNAFTYIAQTYNKVPHGLTAATRFTYFLIFSATSMVFSPIGEELFYRGMVHECFVPQVGNRTAAVLDSAAFALVHVAHFGLVYSGGTWRLLTGPTLVWVSALFTTCLLFSVARARSGSILGAMVAHAGFNLTLNYFIFYHVL